MKNQLRSLDLRYYIGCPCYIVDPDRSIYATIVSVDWASNAVTTLRGIRDASQIKPLLRRFENLSRHEVDQLNKLWPNENIKRTTFDSIKLDADIINFLTLLHVDVFGWIDQGLAIDAAYNNNR